MSIKMSFFHPTQIINGHHNLIIEKIVMIHFMAKGKKILLVAVFFCVFFLLFGTKKIFIFLFHHLN